MYNFGVQVVKEMEDRIELYLEQNIQMCVVIRKEIDLEDAIAFDNIKDINQAERLLVVRRKKRIAQNQQIAMQNSQCNRLSSAGSLKLPLRQSSRSCKWRLS